jgi:hypothetical protein
MFESNLMEPDHLCVELRVCLNAFSADAARKAELRRIVSSYVASCHKRGDPVDRVILSLKEVIRVAVPPNPAHTERDEQDLYGRIARWCVDEHYGEVKSVV